MVIIVTISFFPIHEDIVSSLKEKGFEGISLNTKENNVIYVQQKNKELGYVGEPTTIDEQLTKQIFCQE